MKYILQVSSGSWHTPEAGAEEIISRIERISSLIPVDRVIVGWHIDAPAYRKLGDFLHGAGIRMLLWLPVFSDTEEVTEPDVSLDLGGNPVPEPFGGSGGFVFGCPSSGRNIRTARDIYDQYFSGCGFDGVFLDRIRGQSFLCGTAGVLSCGCAGCRKKYLEEGVDTEEVRKRYETEKDSFFDIASFPADGEFRTRDRLAQRFLEAREKIVAGAAADLCRHFREKGLTVGLDLFAPAVSRFAGQNYPLIAKEADFIKPMLYRRTEGPAGIGYEYALFEKQVPEARGRGKLSLDRAFLDTQLEAVRRVFCEVCPGIEINYDPELVRTDAEYIRESLTAVREHGFGTAALCWNIMKAPETYFRTISEIS